MLECYMAKVTSKLQLTLPKAIADQFKIRPGDELDFQAAGETIRVTKLEASSKATPRSLRERLKAFDHATARQRKRNASMKQSSGKSSNKSSNSLERGWTREDLYDRGLSR